MSYYRYDKHIDTLAIANNLIVIKNYYQNSKVLAIVKSNAYGHGIKNILPALGQADGLGVSDLAEALVLRNLGFIGKIVVLNGLQSHEELQLYIHHQLTPIIYNYEQIDILNSQPIDGIDVWLKVDTGMNRLGFSIDDFSELLMKIKNSRNINIELVMTHLHSADHQESGYTEKQYHKFMEVVQQYRLPTSLSNSAGIINFNYHNDWIRPGLMLYGVSPIAGVLGKELGLQPVMQLQSYVIQVRNCMAGETIGYGGYILPRDVMVGIVPVGYADGYPQFVPVDMPVMVNNVLTIVLGRVSMEKMAVDLTNIPSDNGRYIVQLWGNDLPIEIVANKSQRSAYEILCNTK